MVVNRPFKAIIEDWL